MEMMTLRIPKERVKAFHDKDVKYLKDLFKAEITISNEGEVEFRTENAEDILTLRDIILAIGRGFSFESAMKLLEEDYGLIIVNINDFTRSKKGRMRLKGRVIGRRGKIKKLIERETDTELSIYGKTISIIGRYENLEVARRAVEIILEGKTYSAAFHCFNIR